MTRVGLCDFGENGTASDEVKPCICVAQRVRAGEEGLFARLLLLFQTCNRLGPSGVRSPSRSFAS